MCDSAQMLTKWSRAWLDSGSDWGMDEHDAQGLSAEGCPSVPQMTNRRLRARGLQIAVEIDTLQVRCPHRRVL